MHRRRTSRASATFAAGALALFALSGPLVVAADADGGRLPVERGRKLAHRLCAVCHLDPGQGEKSAPSAIPGFVAIANRPGQNLAGIIDWLKSVPPMMPNHRLSQDEMSDIAAYILSLVIEPGDGEKNAGERR